MAVISEHPPVAQSLERGLAVIRALAGPDPGLTLAEVERRTGLSRGSARRFLLTLEDLGYVRARGHRFALTARVLELGYSYLSAGTLPEVARPHLRALSSQLGESSSVSVLDGTDVVYLVREAARWSMTTMITAGTRLPAHATSMGRILLAGLDGSELDAFLAHAELPQLTVYTLTSEDALREEIAKVGALGWALVDQELEEGLRSIAVPIGDSPSTAVAAMNVSTHASRRTPEMMQREFLPPLLEAAAAIERDLAAIPRHHDAR